MKRESVPVPAWCYVVAGLLMVFYELKII